MYNTIKWRFLLNGSELRKRTGGGGCVAVAVAWTGGSVVVAVNRRRGERE